ncbi:hypothetical protein SAMN05661091_3782 [Paenibacillus uliginis N3/975]|uniref:Uncharacterized protein n=1 Tax=Paenibacillus uliginis N3/975 TaxID=1313296 RepID=A0A1X7HJ02_9BACL|nr:hypothetical protein [Paenibacillus uliginis]SMF87559.1 hypothetical protein SAMN05661091_3782 [Paenibacillus uliginis N3/975]
MKLKKSIILAIIGSVLFSLGQLMYLILQWFEPSDYYFFFDFYRALDWTYRTINIFNFLFSLSMVNLFISFLLTQKKRSAQ